MHGRFVRVVRYGTGGEFCNDGAHMGSSVGPGGSDTRPDMEGFVFLFSLVGGSQPRQSGTAQVVRAQEGRLVSEILEIE